MALPLSNPRRGLVVALAIAAAGAGCEPPPDDASGAAPAAAIAAPGACLAPPEGEAPRTLGCTGLYATELAGAPADGVRGFHPAGELWTDGASKSRYLQLPPGGVIDTTDMDSWVFPVGTKVWKEFRRGGKRLETRFLQKRAAGQWVFATYRWTDDEAQANRLDEGEHLADGYEIPAQASCRDCHDGRADKVLGLNAVSLALPGASGLTLAGLAAERLLTVAPASASAALPDDGTGRPARAIAWLSANCGHCHAADERALASGTGLHLRLSFADVSGGATLAQTSLYRTSVGVPSRFIPRDFPDAPAVRVAAGHPEASVLFARASSREPSTQMPPLGTHVVDPAAVAALADWIRGL